MRRQCRLIFSNLFHRPILLHNAGTYHGKNLLESGRNKMPRITGSKLFALLTFFVCCIFLCPLYASAEASVAIVVDSSLKPYAEALNGFKEEFKEDVDVFEISKYNASSLTKALAKGQYRVVTTIGADPLKSVSGLKGVTVLTGMVVNPLSFSDIDHSNISGVTLTIPPAVSLRVLKKIVPSVKKVGIVYNPAQSSQLLREAMKDTNSLDIELVMRPVDTPNQAADAFKSIEDKVDAFLLIPDMVAINAVSLDYVLLTAFRHKIPVVGFSPKYVKMGALLAVSFDEKDIGRQLADMAHRILEGESVKSVPLTHPRRFSIDVNGRTAENFGITIPAKAMKEVNIYKP